MQTPENIPAANIATLGGETAQVQSLCSMPSRVEIQSHRLQTEGKRLFDICKSFNEVTSVFFTLSTTPSSFNETYTFCHTVAQRMSLAQTQSVKTWLKIQEVDGANEREVALNRRDMMSAIAQTDLVNSLNVPKVENNQIAIVFISGIHWTNRSDNPLFVTHL